MPSYFGWGYQFSCYSSDIKFPFKISYFKRLYFFVSISQDLVQGKASVFLLGEAAGKHLL